VNGSKSVGVSRNQSSDFKRLKRQMSNNWKRDEPKEKGKIIQLLRYTRKARFRNRILDTVSVSTGAL